MKYSIDTEFIESGKTIDLVSIGIVAEDGREVYMQSVEFNPDKASEWVKENVLNRLEECLQANITVDSRQPYTNHIHYHRHGQCTFKNLSKHIIGTHANCPWRTREQIKNEIAAFMDIEKYGKPELIGWCAGYDFVAFCQLFGTMMDLPAGYPHYIKDFQQVLDDRGIPDDELPPQEEGLHNALADARHLAKLWGYAVQNDCWQKYI